MMVHKMSLQQNIMFKNVRYDDIQEMIVWAELVVSLLETSIYSKTRFIFLVNTLLHLI